MADAELTAPTDEAPVSRLIGIGLGTRFLVDVTKQMFSPFLSVFAAGMGIDIVALGALLGLRNAVGASAPAFGAIADRKGYRRVLQAELLISGVGLFLVGISPNLWVLVLGMLTIGVGTSAFVPTLQAYLSGRLPYSRQARGLGIVEYAWALSNIVGLSLMGIVIQAVSWRAPFIILGGGVALSALLFRGMRDEVPDEVTGSPIEWNVHSMAHVARSFLSLGSKATSAWAAIIAGGVLTVAGVNISVIYGAWLQSEYGLQPAALGATALVVGIADLTGSVLVSLFADRLGTRRSTLLGCCVMLVAFALLPILNCGLAPALVGLAFMRFAFEFATVSTIPLLCEQAPSERGKVLGLATASGLAGAVIASVTGPWTFTSFGVVGVAIVSLAATAATALVVAAWVRDARIEASASPLP